jgi:glycosyltransferase involved in cell wall biosynthesis
MVYADADVYVLPSIVEGFPMTALEAMASGLPVIVSEHTFGSDVITDGVDGYIVPIRDSEAIADRLRYLHDHPSERQRIGAAARRRAEHFSWERYGEQVVDLVRSNSRTRSIAEVRL